MVLLRRHFLQFKICVDKLKTDGIPGDECQIRAGRYHENINIDGLYGGKEAPFVIRGFTDERPILDGTIEIKPTVNWEWQLRKKGSNIYTTKINSDIWQLFVDDQMMTNARWPNAKWSDLSVFKGSLWSKVGEKSTKGEIVNRDNSLALTNISMEGAVAVLNIGSFNTYVAKVSSHSAGENAFKYKDTFGPYDFQPRLSRYFIEDHLELLDSPEEWFYDQKTHQLYVWLPKGDSPKQHKLRGKVQTYAIKITNSRNVILKNFELFATTISATSSKWENVDNIRFDSLTFNYPTYSKRMLGDISLIECTKAFGFSKNSHGSFVFFNNTFFGSDGTVLHVLGKNVTFENNLFEYNDWSGANNIYKSGGEGPISSNSQREFYIRNTLRYNGASAGIRPGRFPFIHLNHVIGQCWGFIQNDGSGVQVRSGSQFHANLSYNWVHFSPKYGLRFDGQPPSRVGYNGTMSHNVVFQTNGIMVKGENHVVTNNLAFDKYNEGDGDLQGTGCTLCVLKYVRKNPVEINTNTVVLDNIADRANGGKDKWHKGKLFPVAGKVVENNLFRAKISEEITDARNLDFRPVKGSQTAIRNIGPYKYEEILKYYWIPGRQLYKASTPIPMDGSSTVKSSRRDTVMFLQGYGCQTHTVYFGADEQLVRNANDKLDSTYTEQLDEGANVLYLSNKLQPGTQYFWRVDATTEAGITYKGDVWTFKKKMFKQ